MLRTHQDYLDALELVSKLHNSLASILQVLLKDTDGRRLETLAIHVRPLRYTALDLYALLENDPGAMENAIDRTRYWADKQDEQWNASV